MIPDRIEPFKQGDSERTAFNASTMNELIDAINAFLGLRGVNGITIKKADSGFVVGFSGSMSSGNSQAGGTTIVNQTVTNCLCKYS